MHALTIKLADAIDGWTSQKEGNAGRPTLAAMAALEMAEALAAEVIAANDGSSFSAKAKMLVFDWIKHSPNADSDIAARLRTVTA